MKTHFVRYSFLFFFCLILCLPVYAQRNRKPITKAKTIATPTKKDSVAQMNSNSQQGQNKHLSNADVIRMVKGGFGETVIINAIQTNETQFDLSINALFELKNAGVSQKIIEVMQGLANDKEQTNQPSVNSPQTNTSQNNKGGIDQNPQSLIRVITVDAPVSKPAPTKEANSTDVPEVTIAADMDKVRTVLIRRFTGQGFTVDKDQPSQLVFNKEVGGVKGFMTGLLLGRQQNNPRQILTFVLTKMENGISVLAKLAIVYPDNSGLGNPHDFNNKKVRKSLNKELIEVKKEAEK